jgi:hypothetical protein
MKKTVTKPIAAIVVATYTVVVILLPIQYADLLLGLFFDPEDGDDMFFRNVGKLL